MKLRKLILMMPTSLLIACGGYQAEPINNVVTDLNEQQHISDEDTNEYNALPDDTKDQVHLISETLQDDGTVILSAGKATATVTFLNDAKHAMKINNILVPHAVAGDAAALEQLIMGILGQQLNGLIGLIPGNIQSLIQAGIELIKTGTFADGLQSVFRIVIKGFYDKFLAMIPFGNIIAPILDSVLGDFLGNDNTTTPGDNSGNTNDEPVNTISDSILDLIAGLF